MSDIPEKTGYEAWNALPELDRVLSLWGRWFVGQGEYATPENAVFHRTAVAQLAQLRAELELSQQHLKENDSELSFECHQNMKLHAALDAKELRCPSCGTELSAQDGYWYCTNNDCGQAPENAHPEGENV